MYLEDELGKMGDLRPAAVPGSSYRMGQEYYVYWNEGEGREVLAIRRSESWDDGVGVVREVRVARQGYDAGGFYLEDTGW